MENIAKVEIVVDSRYISLFGNYISGSWMKNYSEHVAPCEWVFTCPDTDIDLIADFNCEVIESVMERLRAMGVSDDDWRYKIV